MAFKFNFSLFATLSVVVIISTFCHAAVNDNQKLLNSFEHVLDPLTPPLSQDDWQSIPDTDDPKVKAIAEFAVDAESNVMKTNAYKFLKVEDGKYKVDKNGITYS
ncbi:hypothetical protein P3S67_027123 [Capsicum chacoense]